MRAGRPSFALIVREEVGQHVVELEGELDVAGAALVEHRLEQIAGATVVVDLSKLTFLDAAGVEALLAAKRRIESSGRRFSVRNVHGMPARVLTISGLDSVLSKPTDPTG